MKTNLFLTFTALIICLPIFSQDNITKDFEQKIEIESSSLKNIETLLKTEQNLLETAKGDSSYTKQLFDQINNHTNERDRITQAMISLKESTINIMNSTKTNLNNELKTQINLKQAKEIEKREKQGNKKPTEVIDYEIKNISNKINDIKENIKKIDNGIEEILSIYEDAVNPTALNDNSPKYMFLNGFNFAFDGSNKSKYVGHINIYVPAKERWGYNMGLLKLNYLSKDTTVIYRQDNVLNKPLDTLGVGSTYKKQYNRYASHASPSTYSIYFQLLYKVNKSNDNVKKTNIYLHGHTELLITQCSINYQVKTIDSTNVTITKPSEIPTDPIPLLIKNQNTTTTTASTNIGIGATLDLKFLDNCSFFFQGTGGAAFKYKNINSEIINIPIDSNKTSYFYLFRSYFQYHTSDSSQIVLGSDIRGYGFNNQIFYSVYAGVNLSIDKIVGLVFPSN